MNNTTNTTGSPAKQPIGQAETIFKIVFYVVLFIVGTMGNFLVVVIIRNKRRRTVNDCFIFNLAISDLTFLCFALPFYFYELFEQFVKFHFYCKFVWPMMSVSLFVGIFTLASMSVERCRAILFPFRPRIKKTTLAWSIAFIWTASVSCIIPLMVVAEPEGRLLCLEYWPSESHRKAYTAALFILQFAVPITVIAVAYITIIIKLVKTKVPNKTSVNHRGQLIKQKNRIENIHVIRTVAIIVVLFVACMLPNQIAWILLDFGGDQYKNLSEKFWLFAEALMFLHSCVNPIIYGTLTRQFRQGYIKYINFICCCGRSAQKTMDLSEQRHYQDRQTNCARPLGRLMYKGSLKSPSIIKSTASTQAATGMSFTTTCRTTSPPKSSTSPSPVMNNKHILQTNSGASGAVQVHRHSFPTFVPVQYHTFNPGLPHNTALVNQAVNPDANLQHSSADACRNQGLLEVENKDDDSSNKETEQHSSDSKSLSFAERSLVAGRSVNYGAMDDEERSLQDTHL